MAGRKIQEDAARSRMCPVTMPILVGLGRRERDSKSKGNHIGVNDSRRRAVRKDHCPFLMAVLMDFYVLATNVRGLTCQRSASNQTHPMEAKKQLADDRGRIPTARPQRWRPRIASNAPCSARKT